MERMYLALEPNPIRMNRGDQFKIEDALAFLAMVVGQRVRDESLSSPVIIRDTLARPVGLTTDPMVDFLKDVKQLQAGFGRVIQVSEEFPNRPSQEETREAVRDAYGKASSKLVFAQGKDPKTAPCRGEDFLEIHKLMAEVEAAQSVGISASAVIYEMLEAEEDERCQEDPGDRAQAGLEPGPTFDDITKQAARGTEDNTLPAWVSRLQNSAANLAYLKREEGIGEATRQFLNDIAGVFRRGGTDEDVGRTLRLHTDHDERKGP